MSDLESLDFAGQISIDRVEITSLTGVHLDVKLQVASIEVYEDIFSPFITGVITLYETLDLLNFFPLAGEEILTLAFHSPTIDKLYYRNQKYYIYKISEMTNTGNSSTLYQLHFVSVEAIVDLNTKLSRAYGGRVSDIVKKILTEKYSLNTQKKIYIEDTSSVTKFVANYWSPMKCINYLTGTATNNSGVSNYVFFENSQGINFLSLDALYDLPVMHEFYQNNYIRDVNGAGSVRNPAKDYMKIQDLSVPEGFDYIDRSMGGMYSSQMISVDPVTKRYSNKLYNGNTNFDKIKHLNKYSLISNKALATAQQKIIYMPKHYGNFNGFTDVTNSSVIQQRTSLMKLADAFKVSIRVLGRTDYTVGQKVYLNIPSKDPKDTDDLDKMMSGNYIIAAMAHNINKKSHDIDMELIKDTYIKDMNKGSFK